MSDAHVSFHPNKIPAAPWKQENKQTKETKGEEKNSHGVGTCDCFKNVQKIYLVVFLIDFSHLRCYKA